MKTAEISFDFQCKLNRDLKYLKFQTQKEIHLVTLIDLQGYEVLKGYGSRPTEALNDLHNNLI
ncbi:MAG: hypothetical protein ACJAUJ_001910 [Salibacteraceae bacterium]|jgi:hypothetical protein